jgi:hypothetical protein
MSSGTSILKSIIQAVNPKDKACYTNHSRWRTETVLVGTSSGLKALVRNIFLGYITGVPSNLLANIVSVLKPTYSYNLCASLRAFFVGEKGLLTYINSFVRDQADTKALLVGWKREVIADLLVNVAAIEAQDIITAIRAQWEGEDQFRGFIRGWWYDNRSLVAGIQPYVEYNLPVFLQVTQPIDLVAYLKVWPYKNLRSDIQGYAVFDLLTRIRVFTKSISDMPASTVGYRPANLMALLLPSRSGYHSMNAYVFAQHFFNLSASMNYVYREYSNLCSIIEGLPIYLLNASIIGWAEKDLSASISTIMPPGYLRAVIVQHGTYSSLPASVAGFVGVVSSINLSSYLSGWAQSNLTSFISSIEAVSLIASIVSKGGAKDVSAYIKVREIIFSELYKFSTINTADLRAYVGFSLCSVRTPRSAYASLLSFISSVPVYDLGAVIEGIKTIYSGTKDLGVFIGYTNKYSMLVKFLSFKHSMSVSDAVRINPAFFKDSLNITFKIIKGQQDLKTYITAEPHNAFLGATIRSLLLIVHGTGTSKALTEELVELDGSRRIWSEYVDVYLHSEKPIYYAGGEVFAQNYGDPIFSFLFKRVSSLGIQHSYTLPYDIFFTSTDEAIRYGFSKISSRTGFVGLGAVVETNIKHLKLNAKIECKENVPLYIGPPFTYLKTGTVSFMGTCINNTLYKSKLNVFGGIQDITSSVSAVAN